MLALAALLALTVTADSATLVSRRVEVEAAFALAAADLVADELLRAGLPPGTSPEAAAPALTAAGVKDSATCEGRSACLAGLGRQLGVRTVVGVDVGRVVDQYALTLEAVDVASEARLARRSFLVKVRDWPQGAAAELKAFAAGLKTALAARPVPVTDAPRVTGLVPPPPPPLVLEPARPVRWPRITLLIAGAASALAAAGLAAGGVTERDALRAAEFTSPFGPASMLTRAQAEALSGRSNTLFTASLICALASAVLAAAGLTLWAFE